MKTSLSDSVVAPQCETLDEALPRSRGDIRAKPGVDSLFTRCTVARICSEPALGRRLGDLALKTLGEYAPDAFTFARAIGLPGAEALPKSGKQAAAAERQFAKSPEKLRRENRAAWMAQTIYSRVLEKLQREPVEDFRIDFEDGYGNRPDAEEDQHAKLAAEEVGRGD